MKTNNYSAKNQKPVFWHQSLKYFIIIWLVALVFSLLNYFLWNNNQKTFWYILNATFFYINIPIFSYALLSLVAERGLFNGIRYSFKQAKAKFFKKSRIEMMAEYSVDDEKQLKHILKEKYLYTSPHSDRTFPLLLASTITFIIMIIFTYF